MTHCISSMRRPPILRAGKRKNIKFNSAMDVKHHIYHARKYVQFSEYNSLSSDCKLKKVPKNGCFLPHVDTGIQEQKFN